MPASAYVYASCSSQTRQHHYNQASLSFPSALMHCFYGELRGEHVRLLPRTRAPHLPVKWGTSLFEVAVARRVDICRMLTHPNHTYLNGMGRVVIVTRIMDLEVHPIRDHGLCKQPHRMFTCIRTNLQIGLAANQDPMTCQNFSHLSSVR